MEKGGGVEGGAELYDREGGTGRCAGCCRAPARVHAHTPPPSPPHRRRIPFQAPPGMQGSHQAYLSRQALVMAELLSSCGMELVGLEVG